MRTNLERLVQSNKPPRPTQTPLLDTSIPAIVDTNHRPDLAAPSPAPAPAPGYGGNSPTEYTTSENVDHGTQRHSAKHLREAWATSQMPPEITSQLWNIHGKEVHNLTFSSPIAFRHIIPHLFSSRFMPRQSRNALCAACPLAREYSNLLRRYRNVDFSPLRAGLPSTAQYPTAAFMMQSVTTQVTACFLHHNCWTPHVIRFIGGQHTGRHRDWRSIRKALRILGVEDEINDDLTITLRQGAPRYFNAEFTEHNFRAALAYGNHPSINESEQHISATKTSLEKDIRKGFAICANPRLLFFVPHVHLTPMGLIVQPAKKPRIYFDSSFRPKIWSMAINDVTDAAKEPDIHFAGAFVEQLAWIWNLRITYPQEELYYIGDDDVSGAFRQVKYHPNMVSLHSCLVFGHLFMYSGQTFGDAPSPPNWEPIVTARKALAQKLWLDATTADTAGREVLPDIDLGSTATPIQLATVPVPSPDSFNRGVLNTIDGTRRPPPYPHHVDDCYYADIGHYFYRTVASSLLALYAILGRPSTWNTDVVSWDKFTNTFSHERRINGWLVNSRTLTLTLPDDKRQRMLDLLHDWAELKRVFTIRELAVLLGTLTDHSRPLPWFRARYAILFHLLGDTLRRRHHAMKHYNLRRKIRDNAEAKLPQNLHFRLHSIVATEVAAALWQSKVTLTIADKERQALRDLSTYARSSTRSWTGAIGHMIPRDPDFTSYGDASLSAGGGYNTALRFYFILGWGPKITQGLRLPPAHGNYCHINDLEFIVIIMQLAATLAWMEDTRWTGIAPIISIWTDNTSSKAWASAAHARTPRLHGLVSLYADLLERGNLKPQTFYIASGDNHQADFLSRLDPHLSPPLLHSQISQQYTAMNFFTTFLPTSELLRAIEARMFSDAPQAHLEPTTNLGRFAAVGSLSSNSWLG